MKEMRDIMGMPVIVEIVGGGPEDAERVFALFYEVDRTFSTYDPESEISRINRGELRASEASADVQTVLRLAEDTKRATRGFFEITKPDGSLDPSGIVKGWAIQKAAEEQRVGGKNHFYIEIAGDIATRGKNAHGAPWRIGIRDPQNHEKLVKVVEPRGRGIATSGTAARGEHIWNPHTASSASSPYLSITVIGPNVYEADRFATAAYAMGEEGMPFLEALEGFEAFAVTADRVGVKTSGFSQYEVTA